MNQKRILCGLICLIMILSLVLPIVPKVVRASSPSEIWDWYDLDALRNYLSGSYLLMRDLDSATAGYTELASSEADAGQGWQPIGTNWDNPFTGNLDGQGYEIRDLFINRPQEDYYNTFEGLFGAIGCEGVIRNIGVVDINVTGHWVVGGLVGWNAGAVDNSYSSGSVIGHGCYAGGLVGFNAGSVTNCSSGCGVTSEAWVGGLVGQNAHGTVINSYSTGSVTCSYWVVGGLVGANEYGGTVNNSHYNYDQVLINGEHIITIGALFDQDFGEWIANGMFLDVNERLSQGDGYYLIHDINDFEQLLAFGQDGSLKFRLRNDLDLEDDPGVYIPYLGGEFDGNGHRISNLSFSFPQGSHVGLFGYIAPDGKVTGLGVEGVNIAINQYAGGLAAVNMGVVSDSYSTGSCSAYLGVGGLVAENLGIVSTSYSSISVRGEGYYLGGLVGVNHGSISDSYSSGIVPGRWDSGGLVGWNTGTVNASYCTGRLTEYHMLDRNGGGLVGDNSWGGEVEDSFWDIETTAVEYSAGGTGKSTVEMRDITTFTDTETEGLDQPWDMIALDSGTTNTTHVWNIVNGETYPFLGWESGKYHLTIFSTEGGSVTVTVDGDEYVVDSGDTVTISDISPGALVILEANPDAECEFSKWLGGPVHGNTNLSIGVTMDIHYSITASFDLSETPSPSPSPEPPSPSPSPECFIATAAYGTPMSTEIQILRDFRDGYLLTNPLGQAFVDFYYRTSPPIAQFITDHPSWKPIVRAVLVPAVAMSTMIVDTSPTQKALFVGMLVLLSGSMAVWVTRRRGAIRYG